MIFKTIDAYGNNKQITSDNIRHILDLLDSYMNETPYTLHEAWMDDVNDKYNRIDVVVRYVNKGGSLVEQKLLILNDEVIDGKTFHKRYKEWYGKED